jgi:phosphate transport system substrate-binding protein
VAFRNRSLLSVIAVLTAGLLGSSLITACGAASPGQGPVTSTGLLVGGGGTAAGSPKPAPGKVTLTETGSSLIFTAFQGWASGYQKTYPNVTITPAKTSSGIGIADVTTTQKNMLVNIGASDAFLSSGNLVQHPDLLNIPLAIAAQEVFYNLPEVPLSKHLQLDGQVLAEMYDGQITNWNDPRIKALNPGVSLPNLAVVPVHRNPALEPNTGDNFLFTSYLSTTGYKTWNHDYGYGTSVAWPAGIGTVPEAKGNSGMVQKCQQVRGCVAYIGISYQSAAQSGQNPLGYAMLRNKAGNYLLPTPATVQAAVQPFIAATPPNESISLVNGPAGNGYPIVNYEYAIVNADQPDATVAADIRAFLYWVVTTGNVTDGSSTNYLASSNFQPLPPVVRQLAEQQIARIR